MGLPFMLLLQHALQRLHVHQRKLFALAIGESGAGNALPVAFLRSTAFSGA
jgi:hypothetical protein